MIVSALAAGAAGIAGGLAYAVRSPKSSLLAPSVYHGDRTRPAIALTFDDGPSESTPELLDILARYDAPATFFQCGANVRRLPQIARQVAGQHEIGNHTDTHPFLHFKSTGFMRRELSDAQTTIESETGIRPAFFRPPFGVRWFGLRQVQRDIGLMGVMWTTIALDWKWPVERVAQRLLKGATNGAIFCLHDGRQLEKNPDVKVTLEAMRQVLPKLMGSGFRFEKVTDILCPTKNSPSEYVES